MLLPIGDDKTGRGSVPFVVYAIIVLNAIVFLFFQQAGSETGPGARFTSGYSTVPYEITHNVDIVEPRPIRGAVLQQAPGPSPIYLTILFSMFMHGSWIHILGNMLFLWVFGDNVEDNFGHVKFTIFYLLAGTAATLAQIAVDPDSRIPTLGASGAIAGVLGSYLLMFPRNRVRSVLPLFGFFFTTVELPAVLVIGFWIVLQIFEQYRSFVSTAVSRGGGVAYMAHIGGFAAGAALTFLFRRRNGVYDSRGYYDQ